MVHHGDEKVEEDDDVDEREAAEHDEAPEPGELLDAPQLEVIQINEAEGSPEESLGCFPQAEAENIKRMLLVISFCSSSQKISSEEMERQH